MTHNKGWRLEPIAPEYSMLRLAGFSPVAARQELNRRKREDHVRKQEQQQIQQSIRSHQWRGVPESPCHSAHRPDDLIRRAWCMECLEWCLPTQLCTGCKHVDEALERTA